MKILCLVKLVPDVDDLRHDQERNTLVRDSAHLMINPEDATAVAAALGVKRTSPDARIETVSMAPPGAVPHLEDLVRRGVDEAVILSDPRFAGSDTWATSRILARFLGTRSYDCVFCGTHTLDGGTAQVPAQVAEFLGLPYMGNILELDAGSLKDGEAVVDVDGENAVHRFSVRLPALLGFLYSPKRKLPYISYEDLNREVRDRVVFLDNGALGLEDSEIGLAGSLTRVRRVEAEISGRKNARFVRTDSEGISEVMDFLASKGFLHP